MFIIIFFCAKKNRGTIKLGKAEVKLDQSRRNGFIIDTKDRKYQLTAESDKELAIWFNAISNVIAKFSKDAPSNLTPVSPNANFDFNSIKAKDLYLPFVEMQVDKLPKLSREIFMKLNFSFKDKASTEEELFLKAKIELEFFFYNIQFLQTFGK